MRSITFYDANGEIQSVVTADEPPMLVTIEHATLPYIDGEWDSRIYYVLYGEPEFRPANPATLTGLVLTNVPAPCKIMVNADTYDCDDSTVELNFPYSGTYKIRIIAFPYLDGEFQIET